MNDNECQACGENLRILVPFNKQYTLQYCPSCRHIVANPLPSSVELKEYYDGFLFRRPNEGEFEYNRQIGIACGREILKFVRVKFGLGQSLKILDYGGGVGFVANGFAQEGAVVTLCDLDKQSCCYAEKKFGNKINVVHLSDNELLTERFDVIYCSQVIEHAPNTQKFISDLCDKVKDGGLIIITTPNQSNYEWIVRPGWAFNYLKKAGDGLLANFVKFIKLPWTCFDPPRHVHVFNPLSLSKSVTKAGLLPLLCFTEYGHVSNFNLPRDYRVRFVGLRNAIKMPFRFLEFMMLSILSMFDLKKQHGNNLVIIAKKPKGEH